MIDKLGSDPYRFVLSPMAGISDMPYRTLCREMGSVFSFSEFISADSLYRANARSAKMVTFSERERPMVIQIFGSDPDIIVEAAKIVEQYQPDGIDINLGCSVRKIAGRGAGSALLAKPEQIKIIFQKLKRSVKLPVSAKIRLGVNAKQKNFLEIGQILESEGAWAVFVHGRTASMAYTGVADWDSIGELKNTLSIPVFGNGDIQSYEEGVKKIDQYGVDGVLIGRAAIGNPWIFSGKDIRNIQYQERLPVILRHFHLMVDHYGEEFAVLLFRKHLVKYLKYVEKGSDLKVAVMEIKMGKDLETLLVEFPAFSGI